MKIYSLFIIEAYLFCVALSEQAKLVKFHIEQVAMKGCLITKRLKNNELHCMDNEL